MADVKTKVRGFARWLAEMLHRIADRIEIWSFPPQDEAERKVREADMPWL